MTNAEREQNMLLEIADQICGEGIELYIDRGGKGEIAFIVCRACKTAREILDDSPALFEERGSSFIITVKHP